MTSKTIGPHAIAHAESAGGFPFGHGSRGSAGFGPWRLRTWADGMTRLEVVESCFLG
jgi:hypothetical protein